MSFMVRDREQARSYGWCGGCCRIQLTGDGCGGGREQVRSYGGAGVVVGVSLLTIGRVSIVNPLTGRLRDGAKTMAWACIALWALL